MTNTPIQVTTDLSTVLQRIEQKIDKLDEKFEQKIDNVGKDVTDLKVTVARLEEGIKAQSGQITELAGKVNLQVTWFLSIITVLVGALVTALGKFVFFPDRNF